MGFSRPLSGRRAKRTDFALGEPGSGSTPSRGLKGGGFKGAFLPAASLFEAGRLTQLAEASRIFGPVILSCGEPRLGGQKFQNYDETILQKRSKFLLAASAALGDGVLVPMGFEYGLERRLARPSGRSWFELAG